MKKLALLALFIPLAALGQVGNGDPFAMHVKQQSTDPSGACSSRQSLIQNSTTGNIFNCVNGQWTIVGGGSGSVSGQVPSALPLATGTAAIGAPSHVSEAGGVTNVSQPLSVNNGMYKSRQDIIDVIADAGAQGAGNTTTCAIGNLSGCHDDYPVLNALFNATSTRKHKIFLKPTTTLLNACDYYSSHSLTTVANIEIAGIVGNHYTTAVSGGQLVTICFASGQGGITVGQASHISGLDLVGGDPWTSTSLSTYVVPTRYGGTGPNADGLVLSANSVAENMNVRQFAGDGIRVDSALVGNADSTTIREVFAGNNRGSGIVHSGPDGGVGTIINAYSTFNQVYGINDYAQYGNTYLGGNTTNNHDSLLPTASWTLLNGTPSGIVCNGTTCLVTMSASNTLFAAAISGSVNKYDLSANDRVTFAGTTDAGLNGHVFPITAQTATTFTFNYGTAETLGAGGTTSYDPGVHIWATLNLRGGGWGIGKPNGSGCAGGSAASFYGPYSESTDAFNNFSNCVAQSAFVIQPMGLLQAQSDNIGGIVLSQANFNMLVPQVLFNYDGQNPQLKLRTGGYNESGAGQTSVTATNNDPTGATTYSTEVLGRRSVYGNVSGWWMLGQGGAYAAATLTKAGIGLCDALTTTGRSNIDNTGCAWTPNLLIGNVRGGSQPDISLDTCTAAPTTGSWKQGDICLNISFNGSGTWAWENTAAGTPGTWTALSFGQVATTSVAGIVKPDGTSITVDPDGTIHSTASSSSGEQIQFSTGAATTMTASSQYYFANGVAAGMSTGSPGANYGVSTAFAGTAKNLFVNMTSVIASGNSVAFSLMKNGVATALTCTMTSAAPRCNDTSNTVSVTQGDVLVIGAVCTGTCGSSSVLVLQGTIQIQ